MNLDRILAVDDDPAFLQMMVAHLERRGFTVAGAANGAEAMTQIRSNGPFSVLVTDLAMPGMGGLELLRQARAIDPYLEVIVVTANDTVQTAVTAMREYGAYDYLRKPLETTAELSMAVGRAANFRQMRLDRDTLQSRLLADARRLETLIANTGDAILAADGQGLVVVANPAAARLLNQTHLLGTPAASLPKSLAAIVANWETFANHQPSIVEIKWGADSTQMVSITPLPGEQGQPGGWAMVIRDITHLKRLDELKMQLLTEAANKIQLPLAQALSALTEFNRPGALTSEQRIEATYTLVKLLSRIQEWMDSLLVLARIEAGIGLQVQEIAVPDFIKTWVEKANEKAALEGNPRITLAVNGEIPPVYTDRELMTHLLQQLAVYATNPARGETASLQLAVRCAQNQVWIEAAAQRQPARRTEARPFARPQAKPQPTLESADVELALVRAIVNRMSGQLWSRAENAIAICLPAAVR